MRIFILLIHFILSFSLAAQNEVKIFKKNNEILKFDSASFYVDRLRIKSPLLITKSEKGNIELAPSSVSMIVKNSIDTLLLYKRKILVKKINGTTSCFAFYERRNEVYIPFTGLYSWVNSYVTFQNDSLIKLNRRGLKVINNMVAAVQIKEVKNAKKILSAYNCQ